MDVKRVAVVTGSYRGIGLAIVKELCTKFEGHVYLTSRNEKLGRAAVSELEKAGLHPRYHQLDIDDESSILKLRDYMKANYGGLDALVNNAAIGTPPDSPLTFHEKAVTVLRTNFFSTHRVCEILFPILRPHARVVNVSSSAGLLAGLPGQELKTRISSPDLTCDQLCALMNEYIEAAKAGNSEEMGWPTGLFSAYLVSKMGVNALGGIYQRRFDRDSREDLIVNSVHPGVVETDMNQFFTPLQTLEEGAAAPAWLALLQPNAPGPKGCFIWHDKQIVDWINGPAPFQPITIRKEWN